MNCTRCTAGLRGQRDQQGDDQRDEHHERTSHGRATTRLSRLTPPLP
ncbi:hypothetical protein [Nonomuraea dietziae]